MASMQTSTGSFRIFAKIVWRDIWRNKRRTFFCSVSVAFGFWLAVTILGIGDYSYRKLIDTSASLGLGHLTIQPKGFLDLPTMQARLSNYNGLRDAALQDTNVQKVIPRITGQALVANASRSFGVQFFAVDPQIETPEVNMPLRYIKQGQFFAAADSDDCIIGQSLAEALGVKLKQRLVYTVSDIQGEITSQLCRVTGIFDTGTGEIDKNFILIPINTMRKLLGFETQAASLLAVFLRNPAIAEQAQDRLIAALPTKPVDNWEILTWRQSRPELSGSITMDWTINRIFTCFISVIIASGILNTMLMNLMERRREMGMLLALGVRPIQLFLMITVESILTGLIGLLLGVMATVPWYFYLQRVGLDMSSVIGGGADFGGVFFDPIMRIFLLPQTSATIVIGLIVIAALSAIYPAYRAASTPPLESIRDL